MAPGRSRRVWITRAPPGAQATASSVRARGCEALIGPLIETAALAFAPPDPTTYSALAFTSATGVRAFSARVAPSRGTPVWAVGRATAAAVTAAGWMLAAEADGDGRALAALIARAPPPGLLLAPGAREPAFDLRAALAAAGIEARGLAVYATEPVRPPPAAALDALHAGRVDIVLLHSPSAARALDTAAPRPLDRVRLLALSPACVPGTPGWRVEVAAAPRERDLLALLGPLDSRPRDG